MRLLLNKCLLVVLLINSLPIVAQKGSKLKMKIEALKGVHSELWYYYGNEERFLDSVRFGENGLANYYSEEPLKKGLYKLVLPNTNSFELIITESKVVLHTDLATPIQSMVVKKSEENKKYYEMQKFISSKRSSLNKLIKAKDAQEISNAEFEQQSKALGEDVYRYKLELIDTCKGMLVADLVKAGMNPEIDTAQQEPYVHYLSQYLDQINFGNSALLHSPIMYSRVVEYVDQVVAPYPDEKKKAIEDILKRCQENKEVENYFTKVFIEKYEDLQVVGHDELFVFLVKEHLTKTDYSTERKKKLTDKAQLLEQLLRGKQFLISGVEDGESLKTVEAKYTLVLVWGENVSKKELELLYDFGRSYEKYGLKIFAVSLADNFDKLNVGQESRWVNVKGDSFFKQELLMDKPLMLILLDQDKKVLARDISLDFLIDTINAWEK